ncbi:MAG: DUF3592 domain-containing protein [Gammaproteobacteria bacterium]|nr:DUF3592 domain-containing protein [Gammaproteobacteria bacterium]
MFNAYALIIGLFIAGGLITAGWGWRLIVRARAMRLWPATEGIIETAEVIGGEDDLLPHIVFSYRVDGKNYHRILELPPGALPSPELAAAWRRNYPAGGQVTVYYDPRRPDNALLELSGGAGDWLIFALGAAATLLGSAMLLI